MSWLFKLLDAAGVNQAGVDTDGNVKVNGPTAIAKAGFLALAGRVDDGTILGTARVNRAYVTEGNQLAIAPSSLLWDDSFNATAQNTGKYRAPITTMTVTFVAGYAIVNGGNIATINTNAALQSYRTFPLFAKSELRCNIAAMITASPQANCVMEMGLFAATLPGAAAPTDGVFFRWNAAGELRGVVSYNGTETQTAQITSPSINVNHDYTIVLQTNVVLFYIDDVLRGVVTLLTDAPTLGQPMSAASVPFTLRQYIGGSAPSSANQLKVSDVWITLRGADVQRGWPDTKAGMGHMAYQGQNGGTMGTTALYANSSNPAATVPTNTTAALGTGLGGKFQETLTLAAGTDGIISSFQNPAGGVAQTPRNLCITGVTISGVVTVALTTNPLAGTMSLAFGHTAVSLATAEAATTKAPRRVALGATSVASATAAIGTPVAPLQPVVFRSPIFVAPGEFIAVTHCKVGAAPATGAIMWSITIDGYFE